jgi:two-component system NtrC family sensor kinase
LEYYLAGSAALSHRGHKIILFNKLSLFRFDVVSVPVAYKLLKPALWNSSVGESLSMNAFPVPFRVVAVTLLSCSLVLIGLFNLRDRVEWTDPTDGVFWAESGGGLKATTVDTDGPGERAGIGVGDRLLSVNGHTIANLGQYYDLIYRLKPGASVTYSLAGISGSRDVTIRLGSKALFTAKDGLKTLLAFLHLGIGIFVLLRSDRSPRALHFYLICLAAFVIYLFSWTPKLGALDWWVYCISISAFLLLPSLFLHFCLRFPVDVAPGDSRTGLLYIPAMLLVILHLFWITGHLAPLGLPRTARSSGIIDLVQLAFFCAGFFIGSTLLLMRRIKSRDLIVRQQMKWVSYGTLAGMVPFSLIYVIPVSLGVHPNFAMNSSILLLAFIPLSMGYAIIHYRLMDVEVIARRSAAYFIASSFLLAVYLVFVLVLGRILQWAAPQASFVAICFMVLVIALLFAPLRNAVQARLDRLFYRDQFEARSTLLDFAQTLSSEISLEPLSRSIVDRVIETFRVDKAAIFLSDQAHNGFFRWTYALGSDLKITDRLYREDELVDSENTGGLVSLDKGTNYLYRTGPVLVKEGLHFAQVLRLYGRSVGMIALGQLPHGGHFSTEDLDLLSALAGYAAMALENANLYRSVESKALELQRMRDYTESIIESINVAVLALDTAGRITSCNRAFEDLYSTTRQKIIGLPVEHVMPADVIASIQRAAGTTSWELGSPANIFKLYLENRTGRRLIVNLSIIPFQNPMIMNSGSLIVLDDITEKVQLEDQLLQAEKLSSIGLLAAGIAHEVNTPLAGISSYTQMLLKDTPESDERKPILEKIEKQTFRAAEIVNGLLSFSRLSGGEFTALDINQLINESLALLAHQLQLNHIKVESRFDDSLPPVYGNLGKLQQVFINLFLNARDAMPSGGEIEVQTGMNDSMIIVDISDTGAGISEENLKRIFDPFFTTKSAGRGTGLGLAVTYGIIQEHGGRIFVDSDPGKGTHFRLKLPATLN